MRALIEFTTEHGTYYVTAEDAELLRDDMTIWGTMVIQTEMDGDRVIGKRVSPCDLRDNFLATAQSR